MKRHPGQPFGLALPVEARDDRDFLCQMLNEQPENPRDSTGHDDTTKWIVVDETIPWDFRDATRYSRCGAEVFTNENWNRIVPDRVFNVTPTSEPAATPVSTPKKSQSKSSRKEKLKPVSGWLNRRSGRFIKK